MYPHFEPVTMDPGPDGAFAWHLDAIQDERNSSASPYDRAASKYLQGCQNISM